MAHSSKQEPYDRLQRLLACCLAMIVSTALGGHNARGVERAPHPPIILISVDTLRADHLGSYGARGTRTGHIDALAKDGTLFSQVSCQVPLTLPSHVSLLTSTYPFSNGVEDNGQQLRPGSVTLSSVLKSSGYRTAAFVGGFVLERRFGLKPGFDLYDSPFDLHKAKGRNPGDIKRLGEDVVRSAKLWIEENSSHPFFVFLHLYDLHTPYDLPDALLARYGEGYDGDLAYVNDRLGEFWEFLRQKGLLDKSLIVFTSDHGEGLGEHSESTHGYFIYQSTVRVPLIIKWPAPAPPFPARIDEPVSLLDVAPTILQFLGVQVPSKFQGRSLLGLTKQTSSAPARDIYTESLYTRNHFGCSALRSLRMGHYKYVDAPKPEFFDLSQDPGETHNLYPSKKSLALAFRERLVSLRARFRPEPRSDPRMPSPEVVEKLAALGYVAVSSAHPELRESGPDPKDFISVFEAYGNALVMAGEGEVSEATAQLKQILSKYPDLIDVRLNLAHNQQTMGQHAEAIENLRQALKLDPLNALAHFNLARSYFAQQQIDMTIKEANAALALAPYYTHAEELLGTISLQKNDYAQARGHYTNILRTEPDDYVAHYNLGALAMMEEKWAEGESHLRAALKTDPQSSEAHNTLGSLYVRRGDLEAASQEFADAVRLEPGSALAHYNLGLVLREQRKIEEAVREFRLALAADPQLSGAREELRDLEGSEK